MTRDPAARPGRLQPAPATRRGLLAAGATLVFAWAVSTCPALALDRKAKAIAAEKPPVLSLKDALLHDAASPVVGNPDGDVTIVAFVDYNCPYCKKSEADLARLVSDDPKIKVIYKDLPILSKTSVAAAKVAIAANWQGKYADMHHALMGLRSASANDADISQAAVVAGVDVGRLNKDLDVRDPEIVALIKRNMQEAEALQLKGTPAYVIGPFIATSPLDLPQFKQIVSDARNDLATPTPTEPKSQ